MNIFDPSVTGIWVDIICLIISIGLLVREVKRYLRDSGAKEYDTAQAAESAKTELAALKIETETARAELSSLKAASGSEDKKGAAKDAEIKRLKEELSGASAKKEALSAKDAEIKRLTAQLADIQSRQDASEKKLKAELAAMSAERELSERKLSEFKKVESDIQSLKNETEDRRKSSHDMKRRIEEGRMKMRLLSEKSKENVELLAGFVAGKEFDEFRKSIHLDELVQKYEDEIKELRIKNMDLEKRAG